MQPQTHRQAPGGIALHPGTSPKGYGSGTSQRSAAACAGTPIPVAQPGNMIHVDIKQLTRFERIGHRITGNRRLDRSSGAGYEQAHVAIDHATQLAYAEVVADEKQATTVNFLIRPVGWFKSQGITCQRVLSDNGSTYRSKPWRKACETLGLTPKRIRPYTPRTNGKAESLIKTLLSEWAYEMSIQSSAERNRWLGHYLAIYNHRRCHMALADSIPYQQHALLRAAE